MKCIYCNSKNDLTSSDIISYAITGAKLAKGFVCKKHNAFTNDHFESEFIENLAFVRNRLGLTTRNKGAIRYRGDVTIDGETIYDISISGRKVLHLSKKVIEGKDSEGKKILIGDSDRLKKIIKSKKNGELKTFKKRDAIVHATLNMDHLFGAAAIHTIAKIAYEWHCYHHNIKEVQPEYKEIIDYILCNTNDEKIIEVIIDSSYYSALDYASSPGTNSIYEFSEDGNLYVVFSLWNTISYKVRIKKYESIIDYCSNLYLYNIDGTRDNKPFLVCDKSSGKIKCKTILPSSITKEIWDVFSDRFEKLLRTFLLSIHILNKIIITLKDNIEKYEKELINFDELLSFGEEDTVVTVLVLIELYQNKDKYSFSKTFNDNLTVILKPHQGSLSMTKEGKDKTIRWIKKLDDAGKLIPLIKQSISFFEEIYNNEVKK